MGHVATSIYIFLHKKFINISQNIIIIAVIVVVIIIIIINKLKWMQTNAMTPKATHECTQNCICMET